MVGARRRGFHAQVHQNVVLHGASFSVGHVLEHVLRAYVAQRPHTVERFSVRQDALVFVNNQSVTVSLGAQGAHIECVSGARASHGYQHELGFHRRGVSILCATRLRERQ